MPPGVLQVNRGVDSFEQDEDGVNLAMSDGSVEKVDLLVGADGIDSMVRRTLWGDAPKREHNLHIFGGFTFTDVPSADAGMCVLSHSRTVQGAWTSIRNHGRSGFQWWMLEAHDASTEFSGNLHAAATQLASTFASPFPTWSTQPIRTMFSAGRYETESR